MPHLGKQFPLLVKREQWTPWRTAGTTRVPLRIPLLRTDCKGNITWHSYLLKHLHAMVGDSPLLTFPVSGETIQSCELYNPGSSHSQCKEIGTLTT